MGTEVMNDKTDNSNYIKTLIATGWTDYKLLDSGNQLKLEQVGPYKLVRPEPQAIWNPALDHSEWDNADAYFKQSSGENGIWEKRNRNLPQKWPVHYKDLRFYSRFTSFKHLGFFPEQSPYWDMITEKINQSEKQVTILNLFGYSGLASLAAAAAGASEVVHVDASRSAIGWAMENQKYSGLENKRIRYLVDDVKKFIQREARRGRKYDGIIADPPAFGRGPSGEIWKIEDSLKELIGECQGVLSDNPLFFIVTTYAIRASALTVRNILQDVMREYGGSSTAVELILKEESKRRLLSTSISAFWTKE